MAHFRLLLVIAVLCFSTSANSVVETVEFSDQKTEQRYRALIEELRCLVCQNQNIADSDADLAKDLRRKTAEMLRAGKSDEHIRNYMRERYGDFVLYKPRFEGMTMILWITPVALLVLLVAGTIMVTRGKQNDEALKPNTAEDQIQRTLVRNLMRDTPNLDD